VAVVCLVDTAARAGVSAPPSVWYRSSEGCPDGPAFVARLHGAAEGAKLATAGDRIDFVVTLGTKNGHAFGQLERQTAEGRVAIRELEAPRCEEVADAVALTLTLALEPQASAAASAAATTPAETATAAAPPAPPPSHVSQTTAEAPNTKASTVAPRPARATATSHDRPRHWLAGADATLYRGSLPDPLLGARLFVELRGHTPWRGASARVAAFFAKRARHTAPDAELLLAGGRLDACPVAFFGPTIELRPCLALELGWEHARGTARTGVSDAAWWASGSASARVAWQVSRAVGLEAEVGPAFPFTRYSLVEKESGTVIHQSEIIGFSAALGAFFALP
jgi:hypothetical protein